MRLHVQKWGNSAAIRLPSAVMAQLGAKVGDTFELDLTANTAMLRVAKPRYKLADLLAQCNPDAAPLNLEGWDDMRPAGQEVW